MWAGSTGRFQLKRLYEFEDGLNVDFQWMGPETPQTGIKNRSRNQNVCLRLDWKWSYCIMGCRREHAYWGNARKKTIYLVEEAHFENPVSSSFTHWLSVHNIDWLSVVDNVWPYFCHVDLPKLARSVISRNGLGQWPHEMDSTRDLTWHFLTRWD